MWYKSIKINMKIDKDNICYHFGIGYIAHHRNCSAKGCQKCEQFTEDMLFSLFFEYGMNEFEVNDIWDGDARNETYHVEFNFQDEAQAKEIILEYYKQGGANESR